MRQAVRFYLGTYHWSSFLVYDKRAGRLMGAVISKEEFGMVSPNVCFNLILRLTMKSKKRKAVKWREFQEKIRDNAKYFIHLFIVQKDIVSSCYICLNQNKMKQLCRSDPWQSSKGELSIPNSFEGSCPPALPSVHFTAGWSQGLPASPLLNSAWSALKGWQLAETPAVVVEGRGDECSGKGSDVWEELKATERGTSQQP